MTITADVLEQHGITEDEYRKIVGIMKREPNLTELGIFSVMWSEHCSYKEFAFNLRRPPTRGPRYFSGTWGKPRESSTLVRVLRFYLKINKCPTTIYFPISEPFPRSSHRCRITCVTIFTMGARPIAAMNSLRFGPLLDMHAEDKRIMEGVVGGIAFYGNCFGVRQRSAGKSSFSKCYTQNPLVNAFALGIFKKDEIFYGRAHGVGNPVIYVGAKTGRDGIHGATMASAGFTEDAGAKRPNVQIGDPFMEKLLLEACLEAMQKGLVIGIQDMGAAGLTCSSCEMGARADTGIELELDNVPQRELAMTAYEIMLSESL